MLNRGFDPDALLAALPRRDVRPFGPDIVVRSKEPYRVPDASMLLEQGSYNGFSARERTRCANLSNLLAKMGCTERPSTCDVCGEPAYDEHAEHYYDLTTWIGLCRHCHRSALHGRFARPAQWTALLDKRELPLNHWARLVSSEPFDLAALLRSRGWREPIKPDYAANAR